jgi:hypothetical protein
MGRAFVLVGGLAVAAVLSTVADATWSADAGAGDRTAELRRGAVEEFVAGPVVAHEPPVLRGPRSRVGADRRSPAGGDGRVAAETGSSVAAPPCAADWRELIAAARSGSGPDEPLEDAAVIERLESRRAEDLSWDGADLVEVVAWLRTASDLDIRLTPAVGYVAFDEIAVTLDVDDVALRTVLDLVTEPHELCWVVKDGRVKIATKDEASGGLAFRYFDVMDLLPRVESLAGDSLVPPREPFEPPEPVEPPGIDLERAVLDLIRETTGGAAAWERPAVLEIKNRIVIARSDPRTLDRVGALVEALIAEVEATGGLDAYLETRRWSTVAGAPPRSLLR